jgi:YVTN family beta-propeller protein/YD repeat-containing protein
MEIIGEHPMKPRFACTIAFGLLAALAACAGPSGRRPDPEKHVLVVLNKGDNQAVFLEGMTLRELGRAPTGEGPHEAEASPDGRFVYVSNYGHKEDGHSVTVLDVERRAAAATLDLGEHRRPHGLALSPDGRTLWVTCEGSGHLVGIDTAGRRVARAIPTGDKGSHMVVLSPDGKRAYTANFHSTTVSAIDVESGTLIRKIECEKGPEGIDLSPDGATLWATNRSAESISVVDTRRLEAVRRIAAGKIPIRVKFTPDGRRTIVSHYASDDLLLFDAASGNRLLHIPIGGTPIGIRIAPDWKHFYVARSKAGMVALVDIESGKTVREVETGREPDGMAVVTAPLNR